MSNSEIIATTGGAVEVVLVNGEKPPVLVFPGGHCTATTPIGADIYSDLGHGVLSFSRPGYGGTKVGPLTAAEFTPLVVEVCERMGIGEVGAVVGISFGGLQAVDVAVSSPSLAQRLILHSCAPSVLPFPDTRMERLVVPFVFGSASQRVTWAAVRRLVSTDVGLRAMMGQLSRLPASEWWPQMTDEHRTMARETFNAMTSGSGFRNDVRQATATRNSYRARMLSRVAVPTLITASPHDGGVSYAHAEAFSEAIPNADFRPTTAATHFYWVGSSRTEILQAVEDFLVSSH